MKLLHALLVVYLENASQSYYYLFYIILLISIFNIGYGEHRGHHHELHYLY